MWPRMNADQKLKHGELTEEIIGAFYAVYNELGFGFLESVYENAMAIALREYGFSVEQQVGEFRCDLLV